MILILPSLLVLVLWFTTFFRIVELLVKLLGGLDELPLLSLVLLLAVHVHICTGSDSMLGFGCSGLGLLLISGRDLL